MNWSHRSTSPASHRDDCWTKDGRRVGHKGTMGDTTNGRVFHRGENHCIYLGSQSVSHSLRSLNRPTNRWTGGRGTSVTARPLHPQSRAQATARRGGRGRRRTRRRGLARARECLGWNARWRGRPEAGKNPKLEEAASKPPLSSSSCCRCRCLAVVVVVVQRVLEGFRRHPGKCPLHHRNISTQRAGASA
jgi:hypothetical protein